MKECVKIWSSVLDKIAPLVSAPAYDIYFSKLSPVTVKDGQLILSAPMPSIVNAIKKNYSAPLNMAIRESPYHHSAAQRPNVGGIKMACVPHAADE